MRRTWPWVLVGVVLAAGPLAVAQEAETPAAPAVAAQPTPAAEAPAGATDSDAALFVRSERHFTLGLADLPLGRGPQFNAFPGAVAGWGSGLGWGPGGTGTGMFDPGNHPPPGLVAPMPLSLKTALTFDLASQGKVQLRLFRVEERTWDDLDTWEKIGLVTSEASAVAGVAYFLSKLVH